MSFDAFGARRDPCTWGYVTACDQGSGLKSVTDRGYTSQEQLDNLGLVHMNGRVYDPSLGRFMSADPRIPDLYNSQDFNRYAYVNNNPLNSTDPSGFDGGDVNQPPMYVPPGMMNSEIAGMLGLQNDSAAELGGAGNYGTGLLGAGNNLFSLFGPSNPTGNQDSTLNSDANNVWTSFSSVLFPYNVAFGAQGLPGSFTDNLVGAGGVAWNTSTKLGNQFLDNSPTGLILKIFGINLDFPQVQISNKGLEGAAIMEGMLALGVVGDASKTGAIERIFPKLSGKTDVLVYQALDETGRVCYCGITNNIDRRASEQLADKGIRIRAIPGLNDLSRMDARSVEQALINFYGLEKDGGQLLNKINSISPANAYYPAAVQRGIQLLQGAGYPEF